VNGDLEKQNAAPIDENHNITVVLLLNVRMHASCSLAKTRTIDPVERVSFDIEGATTARAYG
jgi:hypothetical protein